MKIRDQFATAALAGLVANPAVVTGSDSVAHVVALAYRYADAMLAHRTVGQEDDDA